MKVGLVNETAASAAQVANCILHNAYSQTTAAPSKYKNSCSLHFFYKNQ